MKLRIKKLNQEVTTPEYKTTGASGMDISSIEEVLLAPMERKLIHTGIFLEPDKGYEIQLRPRSGTSIKKGLTLVNCVGTIDEDYRGEVCVPIINLSQTFQTIEKGERIAQMVVSPYIQAEIEVVDELSDTERGDKGFGSTGAK